MSGNDNPLLAQAAKDVPPVTSPAADDGPPSGSEGGDPGTDAGDLSGDGAAGKKPDGRTIDHVRHEFDRKFTDYQSKLSNELAEIRGMLQGLGAQNGGRMQPAATPDLRTMSAAQLEALEHDVPEAQKAAFKELLTQRRSDERTRALVGAELHQHDFRGKQMAAQTQAFNVYPELHDPASRFRRVTNQVLDEMGEAANMNPLAILHAAETAAARLGIKGKTMASPYRGGVGGNTAPPPSDGGDGEAAPMSDERLGEIAASLAGAMPGGKFTKEQFARIKASSAKYRQHKDKFIRQ